MRATMRIGQLFEIRSGDFHATYRELGPGSIPLISCGDVNHGLVGYFDIPTEKQYSEVVTVAYNGQPLAAKFRPYVFGAKDDVGILVPRTHMNERALVYVATMLNAKRWRYSYGRKCFKTKLESVEVEVPVCTSSAGSRHLDLRAIDCLLEGVCFDARPSVDAPTTRALPTVEWVECRLDQIFNLVRGDFHSIKDLAEGRFATVSRTEADNGIVGYYEQPAGSTVYPPGTITVSTVTGDAFVQVEPFIATDNVVMCVPKQPMQSASAYFVAAMINGQKWRYGYGRQPYVHKLSNLTIRLPWWNDRLDEEAVEEIVSRQPYWPFVNGRTP
jgi:hypothetical protein